MVQRYLKQDLGDNCTDELKSIKLIHSANFDEKTFSPWNLLNNIKTSNLKT